ncbi:extracellular solute-binding protein [Paenibacillus paeoniae]|uniref:Extracellular solute-binding protein n=1 Tax=Paenibacillus paeoniae TaxID=2292705 RepID=A0A371PIW8_9BACL|nr:extracellular solute-binding protein [Paenibacillus paeoniae]REK76148.1 extracellular solute-binding protein [Paenibacillus paeoniae]
MKKRSTAWITCLLLLSFLAQGCTLPGIGKEKQPEITVKVIAEPVERFHLFEPLLREKFPHITFEVRDPLSEVWANKNIAPEDYMEAILAIIEQADADLFLNFQADYYIENYPLLDLAPLLNMYGIQLNVHQQVLADQATRRDGTLTTLSPTFNKQVLFINNKLLSELNVAIPESPMSWETFRQTAVSIQEQSPNIQSYTTNFSQFSALEWFGRTIMGWNLVEDNQLTLDRQEWRELFEQIYGDGLKEKFLNSKIYNPRTFDNTGLYITGGHYIRALMNAGQSPEDWSIVELPRDPMNNYRMPIYATNPFAIHAESEYIDELMGMIAYLMSEEGAERIEADVISVEAAKRWEDIQSPFGFVTYRDELTFNQFGAEAIFELDGVTPAASNVKLANEAYFQLIDVFDVQFKAVASGSLSFDQGWELVQQTVQKINSEPSNFVAAE